MTKTVSTFSSKKGQDVNLHSLSLDKDSHLIAKCPENTVLIKLIFQQREKANIIDVGFNCRNEEYVGKPEISENIIVFTDFDQITPPKIECKDSVLTGFEMKKIKGKVQFIWYCGKLKNKLSKASHIRNDALFYGETNLFTKFLIKADLKVEKQDVQGLCYFEFMRTKIGNKFELQYGVKDICKPNETC